MKKVFFIHGFEGEPNGNWRPWMMAELAQNKIYACALAMPSPYEPIATEWVEEIRRHCTDPDDEIYLIGHSLGVPAIFRYLETAERPIVGAILVSGPCEKTGNAKLHNFFEAPFEYAKIKANIGKVIVIHGDDDPLVPLSDAETISRELSAELTVVPGGKHLNGSAGWYTLPQALTAFESMN